VQPRSFTMISMQNHTGICFFVRAGLQGIFCIAWTALSIVVIVVTSCFPALYCYSERYLAINSKRCVLLSLSCRKPFQSPDNWTDGNTILLEPEPLLSLVDAHHKQCLVVLQFQTVAGCMPECQVYILLKGFCQLR
jgi:hypothetical protein